MSIAVSVPRAQSYQKPYILTCRVSKGILGVDTGQSVERYQINHTQKDKGIKQDVCGVRRYPGEMKCNTLRRTGACDEEKVTSMCDEERR